MKVLRLMVSSSSIFVVALAVQLYDGTRYYVTGTRNYLRRKHTHYEHTIVTSLLLLLLVLQPSEEEKE